MLNQNVLRRLKFDNIAEMNSSYAKEGEICWCAFTKTFYEAGTSAITPNNTTVVNSNGLKWLAIAGKYNINQDVKSIITKDPTGFTNNDNITITYSPTTRKVTLTGTFEAYYKGIKIEELISGWVSSAHPATTDKKYFLVYNDSGFQWLDLATDTFDFSYMQIAYVNFGATTKFCLREVHGFMNWETHRVLHNTVGTYRNSGGTLGDYVLNSTTVAQRRPSISSCDIQDEDLKTIIPATTANGSEYCRVSLTSTGIASFATNQDDIVYLSGNQPYYNQFTGGVWQQTLMSAGQYGVAFLFAMPVTSDTGGNRVRFVFMQGQGQYSNLANAQAVIPSSLNMGDLTGLAFELVFIGKVIIRYNSGNWTLIQVDSLTGTRYSQISSPSGLYLSSVTSSNEFSGLGTSSSQLALTGNMNSTLSLVAGTTTVAPLKFTSGSLLSSVTNGVVEYDGNYFYGSTNGTRYKLTQKNIVFHNQFKGDLPDNEVGSISKQPFSYSITTMEVIATSAPSASTTVKLYKNGSEVASFSFTTASQSYTISPSAISFTSSDTLQVRFSGSANGITNCDILCSGVIG